MQSRFVNLAMQSRVVNLAMQSSIAFIQGINGHIIEVSYWTLGLKPRMYVCTLLYGFGTVYGKRLHYTYSWAYTYTILYPYNCNTILSVL